LLSAIASDRIATTSKRFEEVKLMSRETSDKAQPFSALIAASSLLVAVLYLAGFSFRWSYYYNFGVQHLVFNLSFQSILTASMEMIRLPKNLLATVLSLAGSLILVNLLIEGIQRAGLSDRPGKLRSVVSMAARALGFENRLVTDSIRAVVIFYLVYMLSSQMGYMKFRKDVVNSKENTLPVVTAVIQGDGKQDVALACGKEWQPLTNVIGDAQLVRNIEEYHRTCTLDGTVWRLLYRDEKSIYLFASVPKTSGRPLTIVLPNTEKIVLVME
jgi:hypothetical protein